MFRTDFDIVFPFELGRIHHDQVSAVSYSAAQEIGKGAVGKGNVGPPFKNDDLRMFVQTTGPGSRRSAAGDSANY